LVFVCLFRRSHLSAKIDELAACLDWEKDILLEPAPSATALAAARRIAPTARALDIPDSEVVFGGKMKIASDQPPPQQQQPGAAHLDMVGAHPHMLSPHVSVSGGYAMGGGGGGMYSHLPSPAPIMAAPYGDQAYQAGVYASMYGGGGGAMGTPSTPLGGRPMQPGMGFNDASFRCVMRIRMLFAICFCSVLFVCSPVSFLAGNTPWRRLALAIPRPILVTLTPHCSSSR
jgi:hypothetical protein